MIFVTVGSQKFQFNRLLEAVDSLKTEEMIFAQIGYSDYKPKHYNYRKFLDRDEFIAVMSEADIVITHGGTGVIINAIKKGKKVIAAPRLKRYGEHIDDHQIQLLKQFKELDMIYVCEDGDLQKALKTVMKTTYKTYQSNTDKIIESLKEFIGSLETGVTR